VSRQHGDKYIKSQTSITEMHRQSVSEIPRGRPREHERRPAMFCVAEGLETRSLGSARHEEHEDQPPLFASLQRRLNSISTTSWKNERSANDDINCWHAAILTVETSTRLYYLSRHARTQVYSTHTAALEAAHKRTCRRPAVMGAAA
jgi:hypothetical protein